jgi:hypothetical protein
MNGKIGFPVAIHVRVDVGIGGFLLKAQLTGLAVEGGGTDEDKRLVAGGRGTGIDGSQFDPVALGPGKIEDRIAASRGKGSFYSNRNAIRLPVSLASCCSRPSTRSPVNSE